jgi:hypothetical protein
MLTTATSRKPLLRATSIFAVVVVVMVAAISIFGPSRNDGVIAVSLRGPLDNPLVGKPGDFFFQKYLLGSTLTISSPMFGNNTHSPLKINGVQIRWRRGCQIRMITGHRYRAGVPLSGPGIPHEWVTPWNPQGDTTLAAQLLGKAYPRGGLTLRPEWGGGWYEAFEFVVPRFCEAESTGVVVSYQLNGNTGKEFVVNQAKFIPSRSL